MEPLQRTRLETQENFIMSTCKRKASVLVQFSDIFRRAKMKCGVPWVHVDKEMDMFNEIKIVGDHAMLSDLLESNCFNL